MTLKLTLKTTVKTLLTVGLAALALGGAARADGLVIPAYLPLTDKTDWNILKEGAANFTAGTSSVYNDYFVVVTGPASGPFTTATDWATARTLWDPIVANNGEIFGYIHTMTTPTSITFRPLADVERDVTRWVNGYGNLNGIWIDEFYPRYEIAGPSDTKATYPNGLANAPTDRSFAPGDGTINGGVQVNPAGGYYSQLTKWIHAHYPNLKLIGNPGGQFYSNQVKYAGLVNVNCSFENTYAVAANSPANNWANLALQPGASVYPQAALIHTNSVDLNGAIDQSIAHGYKFFYTTSRDLSSNVWGGLPPYFTSEVNYLANHN